MNKQDVVNKIIGGRPSKSVINRAEAYAPANIALCKYWGKREHELNLPQTDSLSISLGSYGTRTAIERAQDKDQLILNGKLEPEQSPFALRLFEFVNLFRPPGFLLKIETQNTIPTAAGLASSASGFAALVLALNSYFGWQLPADKLSVLARMGSGSACRSLYHGFVYWRRGRRRDGMDSYAKPLGGKWPDFRIGILTLSDAAKSIGSRQAMQTTVGTSLLYKSWPEQVKRDSLLIKRAISTHDVTLLGKTAEQNALSMHATMISGWPPVLYWIPETVTAMKHIWALRKDGLEVYFTMDAGANIKLIFLDHVTSQLRCAFPSLTVINPFDELKRREAII